MSPCKRCHVVILLRTRLCRLVDCGPHTSPWRLPSNTFPFFNTVSNQDPSKAAEHGHNVLFVFGDSLFDGGNNMYINSKSYPASSYPYGYTYFTNATGRVCDGRIVPDFIGKSTTDFHSEMLFNSSLISKLVCPCSGVRWSASNSAIAAAWGKFLLRSKLRLGRKCGSWLGWWHYDKCCKHLISQALVNLHHRNVSVVGTFDVIESYTYTKFSSLHDRYGIVGYGRVFPLRSSVIVELLGWLGSNNYRCPRLWLMANLKT